MGEPAIPTPSERIETLRRAKAIVQSVVDDEKMDLNLCPMELPTGGDVYLRDDVEEMVFPYVQLLVMHDEALDIAEDLANAVESFLGGSSDRAYVREQLKRFRERP